MKRAIWIAICIGVLCAFPGSGGADTVITKDGKEVRGIVVEDYQNRIVFSTPDGEVTILKDDIQGLEFDSEEANLIKLAEQARERKDYRRAYYYYDMALKINPNSKEARDGLAFSQGYLFRKGEAKKEDDIRRRAEFEQYGTVGFVEKSPEDELAGSAKRLQTLFGLTLVMKDGFPQVSAIKDGPAYTAGVRMGDSLVSVWSRLTGYMSLKEVIDLLLDRPSVEIKCTIERTVTIPINSNRMVMTGIKGLIGASFSMEFDGLTIATVEGDGAAARVGVKKGDLVTAIDGKSTRYMPLKNAVKSIRTSDRDAVRLTLRRQVVIWRIENQ